MSGEHYSDSRDRALQVWQQDPLLQYGYADFQAFWEHLRTAYSAPVGKLSADALSLLTGDNVYGRNAIARMRCARQPISSATSFRIAERSGPRLVLWLYGPMSLTGEGNRIDPADVIAALQEHSDAAGIYLRIDSAGGSLSSAKSIARALVKHRARKLAIIDRTCWSAAVYVAAAADRIVIRRDATMMVHRSRSYANGDCIALSNASCGLNTEDLSYQGWLTARRLRIDQTALGELWNSGRFFGASEAVDMGFADAIISPLPVPPTTHSTDYKEGENA